MLAWVWKCPWNQHQEGGYDNIYALYSQQLRVQLDPQPSLLHSTRHRFLLIKNTISLFKLAYQLQGNRFESRIAWIEQYVTYTGAWRGVRQRPYCSLCDVYPRTFSQRALTSIRNRHTNDTMLFSLSHAVGFIFVGSTVRILTHAGQLNARNLQQSHQARV